jgi:hypothetical protein
MSSALSRASGARTDARAEQTQLLLGDLQRCAHLRVSFAASEPPAVMRLQKVETFERRLRSQLEKAEELQADIAQARQQAAQHVAEAEQQLAGFWPWEKARRSLAVAPPAQPAEP